MRRRCALDRTVIPDEIDDTELSELADDQGGQARQHRSRVQGGGHRRADVGEQAQSEPRDVAGPRRLRLLDLAVHRRRQPPEVVLQHVVARACAHHLDRDRFAEGARHQDHRDERRDRLRDPDRVRARHPRHAEVADHDIPGGRAQRALEGRRRLDHVVLDHEVGRAQRHQLEHDVVGIVLDEQDTNVLARRRTLHVLAHVTNRSGGLRGLPTMKILHPCPRPCRSFRSGLACCFPA